LAFSTRGERNCHQQDGKGFSVKKSSWAAVARGAAAATLLWSSAASAVLVINSGVDTVSKRYMITSGSSVTYLAGFFGGGDVGPLPISGQFDAVYSRHWWTYYQDFDPQGLQGTFLAESDWVQFTNVDLVLDGSLGGFVFPGYFLRRTGDQLSGDDHPCSFPFGPDTFCSGTVFGALSSLGGQIAPDGRLAFGGFQPTGFFFEGFSYQVNAAEVNAAAVPLPASPWLLAAGLGLLWRQQARRRTRSSS